MDHSLFDPLNGLEGALHQVLPALGQHLDHHVVGDQVPVHQLS